MSQQRRRRHPRPGWKSGSRPTLRWAVIMLSAAAAAALALAAPALAAALGTGIVVAASLDQMLT